MSSYEDYDGAAFHYDATRDAVGVETILGCLATGRRPLGELRVLDAGCGTGNYCRALLAHVGAVVGVDQSEGMLGVARHKMAEAIGTRRAELHRAPIDALPLADASVDAAVVNQVLHHLPERRGEGWPRTAAVVTELARVVRPGGSVVINICSHRQLREGWWYACLVPDAVEQMCARHVPLEQLDELLAAAGLELRGRHVPLSAKMQGENYHDALGPTRSEWRRGDSLWTLVDRETVSAVEARLDALDAAGELAAFVRDRDAERRDIGQLTFVHAVRPG